MAYKLHISAYFHCIFFAYLTNAVHIIAYLMHISCILLVCFWHIFCIHFCIFDEYSLYNCILFTYLLNITAYYLHIYCIAGIFLAYIRVFCLSFRSSVFSPWAFAVRLWFINFCAREKIHSISFNFQLPIADTIHFPSHAGHSQATATSTPEISTAQTRTYESHP